jgi:hypothetical protein
MAGKGAVFVPDCWREEGDDEWAGQSVAGGEPDRRGPVSAGEEKWPVHPFGKEPRVGRGLEDDLGRIGSPGLFFPFSNFSSFLYSENCFIS